MGSKFCILLRTASILGRVRPGHFNYLIDRRIQISVIVEIANYAFPDFPLFVGEVRKSDLPFQVVSKRCGSVSLLSKLGHS